MSFQIYTLPYAPLAFEQGEETAAMRKSAPAANLDAYVIGK
jgi:hypothetical protein